MSRLSVGDAGRVDAPNIVRHTAAASPAAVSLNEELHAGRIFLVDTIYTTAGLVINLPRARGTGNVYTIRNNAVQTLGSGITVAAASIDVMAGVSIGFSTTVAGSNDLFLTTATSDKYNFNSTTTGGLSGDWLQAIDLSGTTATGIWVVRVFTNASGTLATGFAAT